MPNEIGYYVNKWVSRPALVYVLNVIRTGSFIQIVVAPFLVGCRDVKVITNTEALHQCGKYLNLAL